MYPNRRQSRSIGHADDLGVTVTRSHDALDIGCKAEPANSCHLFGQATRRGRNIGITPAMKAGTVVQDAAGEHLVSDGPVGVGRKSWAEVQIANGGLERNERWHRRWIPSPRGADNPLPSRLVFSTLTLVDGLPSRRPAMAKETNSRQGNVWGE